MQIAKDHVVHIDYTLKNDQGEVIDSSNGRGPLAYIQGHGNIIPGLEKELEGKTKGDKLSVSISPEDAYGARKEELIMALPKTQFEGVGEVASGMQFQAQTAQGNMIFTVVEVRDAEVLVDGNHPLAGSTLHFDVEVQSVRDATKEELAHGHVHGQGGVEH